MRVKYIPESITKEVLFRRACDRFLDWQRLFADPKVTAEYMYEDMSCSVFSGNPADDFPDACKPEPEKPVKDNATTDFFKYKGVTFRVTSDETDDKEYIWCSEFQDADELVDWTWGILFRGTEWVGDDYHLDELDKYIDSHKEEQK